jgi:hypothetical protein
MVTCTGCSKSFKKLHGLSLHRNKCRGSSFEQALTDSRSFRKKIVALNFRERQKFDELDPVRNFEYWFTQGDY